MSGARLPEWSPYPQVKSAARLAAAAGVPKAAAQVLVQAPPRVPRPAPGEVLISDVLKDMAVKVPGAAPGTVDTWVRGEEE
jgi:hypothetical protein